MPLKIFSIEIDGINYDISKSGFAYVENNKRKAIKGDIEIKEKIVVDGVVYPVTIIKESAFSDCKLFNAYFLIFRAHPINSVYRN